MLFNSIDYLLFFPIVFLLYFLIPKRFRYIWLLAASYYFYMCWNARYALLMLTSTVITYLSGVFIQYFNDRDKPGMKKLCVALSFASNLAILVFFKYGNFLVENINAVIEAVGLGKQLNHFSVLLPVGISFYTFQALSYTMDVYRKELPAEKNILKYALFVSFFPQLVAGPIERSKNLLTQIQDPPPFEVKKARNGLLLMAWGLFLKIVIADNIAMIVNPVYDNYVAYSGIEIVLATALFAFQIYCDFAGYSYIACGSAQVMGFQLMDNFKSPYLAVSIADFWRRWHISLTTWFRDYLYIPLGGNRKGTFRKYLNTMIVFLVSGLWHGANWTFVIWGALNGAMLVAGEATKGLRVKWMDRFHIDRDSFSHKLFQRLLTFTLINFTWLFFRARDLQTVGAMLGKIFTDLQVNKLFSPLIYNMMSGTQTVVVVLLSILVLMSVDTMKNNGLQVTGWVQQQGGLFRWTVYLGLVLVMIAFGIYGNFYGQTQFIYFQF